jgi:anthranilate phosphoribosyltransferase
VNSKSGDFEANLMANFASAGERVEAGIDLTTEEMRNLVSDMLDDQIDAQSLRGEQIRHLLLGLSKKGETVDELVGAALALRSHMTPIRRGGHAREESQASDSGSGSSESSGAKPHFDRSILLDTCGTGGSGSGTFNISTAAAIVISAAGVSVAKHGNRRATSRSGSADVLAELGVRIESERSLVEQSLDRLNLCFCFAPVLHPAMRHVAAIRRSLGVPSMFNLLGPLCNPAGATHQLLGTGRAAIQPILAEALQRLGTRRSIVVRGEDGQDEVTLDGVTTVIEVAEGAEPKTHHWTAANFGLQPAGIDAMQAADPAHSAVIIRDLLRGVPGPCRDIVIANAAAGFWLVGRSPSLIEGARLAADMIDSGRAADQLQRFVRFSADDRDPSPTSESPQNTSPHPRFSKRAIELAKELKQSGLVWEPQPGHFVYDPQRVLPHESPFQDRLFFVLDLKHFVRHAGSVQQMVEQMTWLPAWWDARLWLRNAGVDDAQVASHLVERKAIARNDELVVLYEMMLERLN